MQNRLKSNHCFFAVSLKNFSRLTKRASFTLIEILIVVILLGVVAGLAVPNFSSAYNGFLLSEAAKDLSFVMRYAQDRSVIRSAKHKLVLDTQNTRYWLEETQGSTEGRIADDNFVRINGRFGRDFHIPEGITVESDKTEALFYPDGKIDKIRIYLSRKKKDYFTISTYEQDGNVQTFDFKVE